MFERRLKLFLILLLLATVVLVGRAFQVQVIQHEYWNEKAKEAMSRERFVETTRGSLIDVKRRVVAEDRACMDACVDYPAIPKEPDAEWVRDLAKKRVRARRPDEWRAADAKGKAALLEEEIKLVHTDLDVMWLTLAKVSTPPGEDIQKRLDEIDDIRTNVVLRVEMRRRATWYRKFEIAQQEHTDRIIAQPAPWYRRWLTGDNTDAPQLDQFDIEVKEQSQPHVILRNIDSNAQTYLWKQLDRFPGLVLMPSVTRTYVDANDACHVIGQMGRVLRTDVENDPNIGNPFKQYLPNDMKGRTGLEKLCEPLLRGQRGRREEHDNEGVLSDKETDAPKRGANVRLSIDMDLQHEIASAFQHTVVDVDKHDRKTPTEWAPMLGACVVIDVPTGEIRAMVSVPTYDINAFDDQYGKLAQDYLGRPLMNRATQFALPPGSTAKPMVGLAAINQGVMGINDAIECLGYLYIGGKKLSVGRCWTMSKAYIGAIHHTVPPSAPHPTGLLNYADALERSCNVYFETLADRLGDSGMQLWMDRFGLGRKVGIGLPEVEGSIPGDFERPAGDRSGLWFSGMGQGEVTATPLQMANVAATIARGGVWKRPTLFADAEQRRIIESAAGINTPDTVDLHLSSESIAAAKFGMENVVAGKAGTGIVPYRRDLRIAGKTGTAQATPFSYRERDLTGTPIRQPDGSWPYIYPNLSIAGDVNEKAPWYRGSGNSGTDLAHSWYIAFAPADHPKIAIATMVEYGGSGGIAAGSIVKATIEACVQHGYLIPDPRITPAATDPGKDTELLQDAR